MDCCLENQEVKERDGSGNEKWRKCRSGEAIDRSSGDFKWH